MAASPQKKNQQPDVQTSSRYAPMCIALGVVLLTFGLAFLLSRVVKADSYVLTLLSDTLNSLGGALDILVPFWLMWLGLKLLASARHQVAVRDVLLLSLMLFSLLAFRTLISFVTGGGNLMEYIKIENERRIEADPAAFTSYLKFAYNHRGSNGGGLLGMLLAYPLWRLLGWMGAVVMLAILMITALIVFFRLHPIELFNTAAQRGEDRRMAKLQKQANQPQAQTPEPVPLEQQPVLYNAPFTPPSPGQQVYTEHNPYQAAPVPTYTQQPVYQAPRPPVPVPDYTPVSAARLKTEDFINYPDVPLPQVEEELLEPQPIWIEPEPLHEEEDDLPWDAMLEVPNYLQQKPVAEPAPRKPRTEQPKQPAPEASGPWASQVKQKQQELEEKKQPPVRPVPQPVSTPASLISAVAQPVYTDPVMPLTGERVAISKAPEPKTDSGRVDQMGTPSIKQTRMSMPVPYAPPPIRLLNEGRNQQVHDTRSEDEQRAGQIQQTLGSFNIPCEVKEILHGPAITRFAIQIGQGVPVGKVINRVDNISLDLKTKHVRVEAPIQGTNYIGIEVPNGSVTPVPLRDVLDSPAMRQNPSPLVVALGKDIAGAPVLCDLSRMPHLLIAGATGSGKSVCINSIVCSLLYRASPQQVRLIMIDPKQVELQVYNGVPHLLVPVISDPKKAAGALSWVVTEMFQRYQKFSAESVRNIAGFNKAHEGTEEQLPNIVVIIDEMADLMEVCKKDVEESIRRLAALARAAGIYMVVATQRPSVDVITGVVKNNIPSRIAFAVSSGTDSRTIIDIYGAEKLVGKGDMLYKPTGVPPVRVQGCYVSDDEVNAIAAHIGERYKTDYLPDIQEHLQRVTEPQQGADDANDDGSAPESGRDDLLVEAIQMAIEDGQISTSMLQRRLSIGYARAGRLVDEMERRGVVSRADGSKPRKTLITREEYYQMAQDDD